MTIKSFLMMSVLAAILIGPQPGWAKFDSLHKPKSVTLLMFESAACSECQDVFAQVQQLQANSLTIVRHTLEDPASQEAFTQHQVTRLPEYILLDQDEHVVFDMQDKIDPDQLVWEIKENLGKNETLDPPKALKSELSEIMASKQALVILFWSWNDPQGQALSQTLLQESGLMLGDNLNFYSFNSEKADVQQWMASLEIPQGPAYVLVTPQGSIYRKSGVNAKAWQLDADLKAYAKRFNSEFQTILAGLTSPVPVDDAIHPATMPPVPLPASDETSPPEQY